MNGKRHDGNDELQEHGFETIPESELAKGTTKVTFFGKVHYVPDINERVEVRVADGSWRSGYRAISKLTTDEEHPEKDVVWISAEDEWSAAQYEQRRPAGAPWPLAQMRPVQEP